MSKICQSCGLNQAEVQAAFRYRNASTAARKKGALKSYESRRKNNPNSWSEAAKKGWIKKRLRNLGK